MKPVKYIFRYSDTLREGNEEWVHSQRNNKTSQII